MLRHPFRFCVVAVLLAVCLLAAPMGGWAFSDDPPPNVQGDYVGLFLTPADGAVLDATVALTQDPRRRLRGEVVLGELPLPVQGAVGIGGACAFAGQADGASMNCRMGWERFGGGAGALVGEGQYVEPDPRPHRGDSPTRRHAGAVVFFRPFAVPPAARTAELDVRGDYAGTFHSVVRGDGTLTARITDGTSNTLRLALAFTTGRQTISYVCVGDVAADGSFAGVGAAADGSLAVVRGYIEQDNLIRSLRFSGDVQIKTSLGRLVDTNSIIAILIG